MSENANTNPPLCTAVIDFLFILLWLYPSSCWALPSSNGATVKMQQAPAGITQGASCLQQTCRVALKVPVPVPHGWMCPVQCPCPTGTVSLSSWFSVPVLFGWRCLAQCPCPSGSVSLSSWLAIALVEILRRPLAAESQGWPSSCYCLYQLIRFPIYVFMVKATCFNFCKWYTAELDSTLTLK